VSTHIAPAVPVVVTPLSLDKIGVKQPASSKKQQSATSSTVGRDKPRSSSFASSFADPHGINGGKKTNRSSFDDYDDFGDFTVPGNYDSGTTSRGGTTSTGGGSGRSGMVTFSREELRR
jgi:hypothetical protein